MADIQVGNKVRILANYSVKGHLWLPSNSSKHLKSIKTEHLINKFGIVISPMCALSDDEVFVKDGDYSEALLVTLKPPVNATHKPI